MWIEVLCVVCECLCVEFCVVDYVGGVDFGWCVVVGVYDEVVVM